MASLSVVSSGSILCLSRWSGTLSGILFLICLFGFGAWLETGTGKGPVDCVRHLLSGKYVQLLERNDEPIPG